MFSYEFAIEANAHNVTKNGEAARIKIKALCGSFDWS